MINVAFKQRRLLVVTSILALCLIASARAQERLIDYVNPFITTGGQGFGVGSGYPGPAAPFGLIHPGPDTSEGDNMPGFYHCAGYYYGDTHIRGFSHTRIHGIGVTDLSNIMLMPTIGRPEDMMHEKNYRSEFSHKQEEAAPGYYAVTLNDTGIRVELTTGERAAHHRYTFPAAEDALVVMNPSHLTVDSKPLDTEMKVDIENGSVTGWFQFDGGLTGRGGTKLKIYYYILSKTPFELRGMWKNDAFETGQTEAHAKTAGALLGFNTSDGQVLEFKVAISYISVEQARANLEADAPDWDFDGLMARTQAKWESLLGRIKVQGGAEKHRVMFYSGMYHSMLAPTLYTEAGGNYLGFDGKVHQAEGFRYYSDMSMWDTFRTLHPLLIIAAPEYQRDFVVSMIKMAEQGGYLPKWPAGTGYTNCMISTPADNVIADTYLKGITDFDVQAAYESMKEVALGPTDRSTHYGGREGIEDYISLGYLPADKHGGSVSKTQEHAFNDFAISQLAAALGYADDAAMFLERSRNYKNLYNPESGFFDGRNADGAFLTPGTDTAWREVYTEGTAWQWLWFAPHDVPGLMELMGGRDAFLAKLDTMFEKSHKEPDTMMYDKYYWHGNEPDIHAAYLFLWAGRPDRTQEEVRWILRKKYKNAPDGVDGNDDAGTLSSWFVFSSMGLFPIPATNRYLIGSPIFDRADISLQNGNTFTITAPGVSGKNLYVQEALLNGEPLENPYIEHADLAAGGALELRMGPEPSDWGRDMKW